MDKLMSQQSPRYLNIYTDGSSTATGDIIQNKGKEMLSSDKSSNQQPAAGNQGGQDYGDKAINAAEAKFGFDKDHKYDKYEEKGSDAVREQIEKRSGKNIPDKVSN